MKCLHCDADSDENPEKFYIRNGKPRTPCKSCDSRLRRNRTRGSTPNINMYQVLYKKQNGRCAICGEEEKVKRADGSSRRFAIDHCHATGQIRGLLCTRCNLFIGQIQDNVRYLVKAMDYILDNAATPAII